MPRKPIDKKVLGTNEIPAGRESSSPKHQFATRKTMIFHLLSIIDNIFKDWLYYLLTGSK